MAKQELEKHQPGVKYPIVKAKFDLELIRRNYQELLQNLSSVKITQENVNDDVTKEGREVLKALVDKKDEESKEPIQWHRDVMTVFKDLSAPIEAEVTRILAEKKVVAAEIQKERDIQIAEQTRITNAKLAIVEFTNKVVGLIAVAKTDADIVSIEKSIGSEKTKKSLYQEFLPDLVEKCDALRPQIKDQKENIRNLMKIQEKEKTALETGDIIAATELREQKEHIEQVIQETGIRIHETAYEQATTVEIVAPEVMDTAPKGRTNWKWRVDDIRLLQKKMPHLVKLVPDDDAIELLLKTKRLDGSLKDKMEDTMFGLTFYNDKSFTR